MKTVVRVTSRQDEHVPDEYLWPENVPLVLPRVGDEIAMGRFGLRQQSSNAISRMKLRRPVLRLSRI